MKVILSAVAVIMIFSNSVKSQTLEEKSCIILTISKLPAINGLIVSLVKIKEVGIQDGAKLFIESFPNPYSAMAHLQKSYFYDDKTQKHIDHLVNTNNLNEASIFAKNNLSEQLKKAAIIDIDVKIANLDVTYSISCVWSRDGELFVGQRQLSK